MEASGANTYRFKCEVVEVIYAGDNPVVKMICNPGSMIVEVPYEKSLKLGDHLIVTGELDITSTEKDCNSEIDHIPRN
jgi:hypothetical protein